MSVRSLARAMGGDVTGHSEGLGRGSTFTVTLQLEQPLAPTGGDALITGAPPSLEDFKHRSPSFKAGHGRLLRVLVAEDSSLARPPPSSSFF